LDIAVSCRHRSFLSPFSSIVRTELETKHFIEGLSSRCPNATLQEKLQLFGQFVGDWDILEDKYMGDDGKWITQSEELHWGWILGGRAVQDVWMSHDKKNGKSNPDGTTVRFYDPKIYAWHSVWISPALGVVRTFLGRETGNEIVLEETNADRKVKWIFSEITPESFRWHSEESADGKSWNVREEMRIKRR
jgi:hypothetical protein